MGIERTAAALLVKLHRDGVRFGRVLTMGRQTLYLDPREYAEAMRRCGRHVAGAVPPYADQLFAALGASSVDALDASGFEGAALVHDLNAPVPAEWHERYDVVLDAGTLEHVFRAPVALASMMQMLRVGGHLVIASPTNSWCGHGFYQFSPEFFWRALALPNGFSIVEMYVTDGRKSYAVAEPRVVRSRVELCTPVPMTVLVHARRDRAVQPFTAAPQQSDYEAVWSTSAPARPAVRAGWKTLPLVRTALQYRRHLRYLRQRSLKNAAFYTPVDLSL